MVASLLEDLIPYEDRLRNLSLINFDKTGAISLPGLFGDQPPRLRELSLRGIRPLPANQFRDLTFLALSHIYNTEFRLASLLEILRGSPLLLDFSLDTIDIGSPLEGGADRPPVPLRHLKRFHLARFQPKHTVRLLQSLELPTGVAMRFTDTGGGTISSPVPFPPELSLQTATKLEIIFPHTQHAIYHSISPRVQMRTDFTSYMRRTVNLSWTFEQLFKADNPVIKELWIFAYRTTMYGIGPLHLLDSLETLVIQQNPEHPRQNELYVTLSPKHSSGRQGKVPCPRLTTLDMSVNHHDRRQLLRLLGDRAAAGSKLKTLRLLRSQIPQADVESFSRCVEVLGLLDEHEWPRRMELPEVCLEVGGDWWQPWGHDF
jgi:hypothetical protein